MSLINSVLVELEQRRALPSGAQSGVLHGLDPVNQRYFDRERRRTTDRVTVIAIGLLAVFALVLAANSYRPGLAGTPAPTVAPAGVARSAPPAAAMDVAEPERGADLNDESARRPGMFGELSLRMDEFLRDVTPIAGATAAPVTPAGPEATADSAGTVVSSLAAQATERGMELELSLSDFAAYSIYPLSGPDRLVIEIDGAQLADGLLPQGLSSETITGYRPRYENGRAVIVLDLAEPVSIVDSTLQPSGEDFLLAIGLERTPRAEREYEPAQDADLPDQIVELPVAAVDATASFEFKTRAEGSAEFQHAVRMYQDGRIAEGLARMVESLSRNPGDAAGRTALVNALVEQRDYQRAIALLDEGLAREAARWQWAMLKAQVLNSRHSTVLAIDVLETHLAAAQQAPEYLALLAGLLQKIGNHVAAADFYGQLVQRDSDNGLWWLGLGISRQALAQTDEARRAFDMALRDPALRPDLRKFAQGRLETLDHS